MVLGGTNVYLRRQLNILAQYTLDLQLRVAIMCGRYAIHATKEEIQAVFGVVSDDPGVYQAKFNIAPGSFNPVVLEPRPNIKGIGLLKWGLTPPWAEDPNIGFKMFNARSETLEVKTSFKRPYQRMRCLIPANGFYEWQQLGKEKIPYYIRCLDQELFAFAGLYEKWKPADAEKTLYSYTIITTAANDLVRPLHERMPVILHRKDYQTWLNPLNSDTETLNGLLRAYPFERMMVYRVGTEVNSTSNEGPKLIIPADT